jgi:hypothetical protein
MRTPGSDADNKRRHHRRPTAPERPASPSSWIAHHRPAPLLGRAQRLFLGLAGVGLFVSVTIGVANRPSAHEAFARALEATAPAAVIRAADDERAPARAPIVTPLESPQDPPPAMTSITSPRRSAGRERAIETRAHHTSKRRGVAHRRRH